MTIATSYFVTHSLGRADIATADADAIVKAVNAAIESNGDSLHKDRVQTELDSVASAEIQKLYRITVDARQVDIED